MGFVLKHADSFHHCVASPFHSFVTPLYACCFNLVVVSVDCSYKTVKGRSPAVGKRPLTVGIAAGIAVRVQDVHRLCQLGETFNHLELPRNTNTGNTYNQHKRPPVGTTHRPSIRHHRKGRPRVAYHQPAQQPCMPPVQQPPALITNTQQSHRQTLSADAAQCEAQAG